MKFQQTRWIKTPTWLTGQNISITLSCRFLHSWIQNTTRTDYRICQKNLWVTILKIMRRVHTHPFWYVSFLKCLELQLLSEKSCDQLETAIYNILALLKTIANITNISNMISYHAICHIMVVSSFLEIFQTSHCCCKGSLLASGSPSSTWWCLLPRPGTNTVGFGTTCDVGGNQKSGDDSAVEGKVGSWNLPLFARVFFGTIQNGGWVNGISEPSTVFLYGLDSGYSNLSYLHLVVVCKPL